MGKGPNTRQSQETSRRPSLSERIAATEGSASAAGPQDHSAPDPCRDDIEISIKPEGGRPAPGEPLWLILGTPPLAVTASGVVGPVQEPEAARVDACLRLGIRFAGVVTDVAETVVRGVVHGQ